MGMYSQSQKILEDASILSETHLPAEIHTRESHLKEIALRLWPLTEGKKPIHCWLHGKPGVGKTATARFILHKLHAEAGVRGIYVNCWENPTFFSVLEYVAKELRILGAEKTSTSFKLERLKRHISNNPLVIVLDEVDQPPPRERHSILYNLSAFPTIGLVCVCNSEHVYFSLEERVKSRLNPARILFEEYTADELLSILNMRSQEALAPDTYTEQLLRTITHLADGDARIAIHTLKNAAYLAEKENHEKIKASHIKNAWNSSKDMKKTHLLHKLTDHHRLLFELITKNEKVLSGDLWRLYLKTCNTKKIKPIAIRTYSDYCNKLIEIGIVHAKRAAIQGKVREFIVVT